MRQRLIASAFLSIWLTLLGVEVAEQAGYFVFPDRDIDASVDAAVLGLGVALGSSEGAETKALLARQLPESVWFAKGTGETDQARYLEAWAEPFLKKDTPFRKLYHRFLI